MNKLKHYNLFTLSNSKMINSKTNNNTIYWSHNNKLLPTVIINLCKKYYDEQTYDFSLKNENKFLNMVCSKSWINIFKNFDFFIYKIDNCNSQISMNVRFTLFNIAKKYSISEDILMKYCFLLSDMTLTNIISFSKERRFSDKFYNYFYYCIDWEKYSRLGYINEEIYHKYLTNNRYYIDFSKNINLDIDFMMKYYYMIDWKSISLNRLFSKEELYKLQKYIDWQLASWQPHIDDKLIDIYCSYMDIRIYMEDQDDYSLDNFLKLFKADLFIATQLISRFDLTYNLLTKCNDNINHIIAELHPYLCFDTISSATISLHKNIYLRFENRFNWDAISMYHYLNNDIISIFKFKINFKYLKTNIYHNFKCKKEHNIVIINPKYSKNKTNSWKNN